MQRSAKKSESKKEKSWELNVMCAIVIDRKKKLNLKKVYTCLSLGAFLPLFLLLLIAKNLLQLAQQAMPLLPLLLTREP
jgi:hypothetical protein